MKYRRRIEKIKKGEQEQKEKEVECNFLALVPVKCRDNVDS
jgi:hypothetical protein